MAERLTGSVRDGIAPTAPEVDGGFPSAIGVGADEEMTFIALIVVVHVFFLCCESP